MLDMIYGQRKICPLFIINDAMCTLNGIFFTSFSVSQQSCPFLNSAYTIGNWTRLGEQIAEVWEIL